jgi:hypothetical protein
MIINEEILAAMFAIKIYKKLVEKEKNFRG